MFEERFGCCPRGKAALFRQNTLTVGINHDDGRKAVNAVFRRKRFILRLKFLSEPGIDRIIRIEENVFSAVVFIYLLLDIFYLQKHRHLAKFSQILPFLFSSNLLFFKHIFNILFEITF